MLNDYEVLFNIPAQCTVTCHSFTAEVYQIDKDTFTKLDQAHEESFRLMQKVSIQENEKIKVEFVSKLFKTL